MEKTFDADTWQARAVLCELLAFSHKLPDKSLVEAICSGEWAESAWELSSALNLPASQEGHGEFVGGLLNGASGLSQCDRDLYLHRLRAESTRLFRGFPDPACSPYETIWRAEAEGVKPLLFVSKYAVGIEKLCREIGIVRSKSDGMNEPLDHIISELEVLQYLASVAGGIAEPLLGTALDACDYRERAIEAYDELMLQHFAKWIPDYAKTLAKESKEPFYRSAARLLNSFVEAEEAACLSRSGCGLAKSVGLGA